MQKKLISKWFREQIKEASIEAETSALEAAFPNEFAELDLKGSEMTRLQFTAWLEHFLEVYEKKDAPGDYMLLSIHMQFADLSEVWNIENQSIEKVEGKFVGDTIELPADFVTIGGDPEWIQDEDFPICKECDRNMALFAEFNALPKEVSDKHESWGVFEFYDAGKLWVFSCPKCMTFETRLQCY